MHNKKSDSSPSGKSSWALVMMFHVAHPGHSGPSLGENVEWPFAACPIGFTVNQF